MEFGMAAKGLEASCQERAERIYGGFVAARRFDLDEFSDGLDQGLAAFFKPVKTAGGGNLGLARQQIYLLSYWMEHSRVIGFHNSMLGQTRGLFRAARQAFDSRKCGARSG